MNCKTRLFREKKNVKGSQCYNVSVLMNHQQGPRRILFSDFKSMMDFLIKIFK